MLAVFRHVEFGFLFAVVVRKRVADYYSVLVIPEGDGVEEGFGIGGLELKLPVLAGVGGVVDA